MNIKVYKTPFQKEHEARDMAVYRDWVDLMSIPGQKVTAVGAHLMEKYNIHSYSTICLIRRRVERKLKMEEKL